MDAFVRPWKRVAEQRVSEHDPLEPVIDEFAVERYLRNARVQSTEGETVPM